MNDLILEVANLEKSFATEKGDVKILDNINFNVSKGEIISIVGPSGSGKTTLLGLCAGLDSCTNGSIRLVNQSLEGKTEDEKASIRNEHIGFVFQNFQLIPSLTALENVMVPIELKKGTNAKQKAIARLKEVGLEHRQNHYPTQLSGGEQQRVAIARAFVTNPKILFADEPTGNLDDDTSASIEELIFNLNKEHGTTLIMVTHDLELAQKTNRIIRIKSGQIDSDTATNHD